MASGMPRAATTCPAAGQTIDASKTAGFTFAKWGSAYNWQRGMKAHTFFLHEISVSEQYCISYTTIRRLCTSRNYTDEYLAMHFMPSKTSKLHLYRALKSSKLMRALPYKGNYIICYGALKYLRYATTVRISRCAPSRTRTTH